MPKLNPIITYIVISFFVGFLLGCLVPLAFMPKEKIEVPIEVEKYIIKESQKVYDSLALDLVKKDKRIEDLKQLRYETIKNHKPLERVHITDSARASNVTRFFK